MRRFMILGFALASLASGGQALAQQPSPRPRRVEVGLSSGYSSVGLGNLIDSSGFGTLWAIPLLLDVDYRLAKHWSVGAYGEVGFIDNGAPDEEDVELTVKGHHYRLGVEVLYRSSPERRVQPWLGVGLGFDALRATYRSRSTLPPFSGGPPDPGSTQPVRETGFEVGHAQLGIDFALLPAFAFGPFVGASVVTYGSHRVTARTNDFDVWANVGLKATVRL